MPAAPEIHAAAQRQVMSAEMDVLADHVKAYGRALSQATEAWERGNIALFAADMREASEALAQAAASAHGIARVAEMKAGD